MKRTFSCLAVSVWLSAVPFAQDHAGQYPPADIAAGSRVYAANCASCHGATGVGVGGIDLRRGRLPRAPTDEALAALVASGIPGTGMPSFRLTPDEMRGLIAFVRGGLGVDANAPPVRLGNAARGRTIFEAGPVPQLPPCRDHRQLGRSRAHRHRRGPHARGDPALARRSHRRHAADQPSGARGDRGMARIDHRPAPQRRYLHRADS